jgi:putative CocE/NonD family hydrolase
MAASALSGADPVAIDQQVRVHIPMRDGIRLEANIFRPSGPGRWPVVLMRTPYGKGIQMTGNNRAFVEHGYAVVVEDVRGRHDSDGIFRPFEQEGPDGEDTIAWIARQPWSDGKVGMIGTSYSGFAQWRAALRNPPALKAIFPIVSGYDEYLDRFYSRGGAFKSGHRLLWIAENLRDYAAPPDFAAIVRHLPLRTADRVAAGHTVDWYQRVMDHPSYDGFWRSVSTRDKLDQVRVPVFAVGGWFDNYGQSDLEAFSELRRLGRQAHVMIGPWPHNMADKFTTMDFGREASVPMRTLQFAWFDHWLKGKDTISNLAPSRYFVMGDNRWQESAAWPPREAVTTPFYLASKGKANGLFGDGTLEPRRRRWNDTPDQFVYDPKNPVPTRGGAICCNFRVFPPGPMDQREVERRADVLVYTTGELKKELQVTGPIKVLLYVSSSAPDTDFTAKITDVYPDGASISVTDGILRMRYRNGLDRPELLKTGDTYPIRIDAGVTSIVFRKGHRIRLEVSSSNFPRFDRNPNTGRAVADETELRPARQTLHHGPATPSALLLPVVARR